jgi:SPP1 gp7 family putative phage head morphogenesis protein
MQIDLAGMVRRTRNPRRNTIDVRPIQPTATMAGDLYRAAYKPIIQTLEQALERIGQVYEGSLPSPVTRDSAADLQSTIDHLGEELTRLVIRLTPALRAWTLRAERWQRGKWRGAVLTATGIDLETMLSLTDVSETVESFIAGNVALMKDIAAQGQARISEVVFRNYSNRTPIRDVAKELRETVGMSKKRAMNVASDQNSKLAARLDEARQEQAGGKKFKWHHSRKLHPRKEHQVRDGNVYEWTDPAVKDDKPGYAPFCGCRAGFVLELG